MKVVVAGEPFDLDPRPPDLPLGVQPHEEGGVVASLPGVYSVAGELLVVLHRSLRGALGGHQTQLRLAAQHVGTLYLYATGARTSVRRDLEELGLKAVGSGQDLLDRVEAGLALWADYKLNGFVVLAEQRHSPRSPGRIDWHSSLARGVPVHGPSGEVYQQIIRRRVRRSPQHPLAQVHHLALQEVARTFSLGSVPHAPQLSAAAARGILETRGREVFTDRLRGVVRLLGRWFAPRGGTPIEGSTSVHALCATSYEQIWEEMLRVALGHEERRRDRFSGLYHLPGEKKPKAGITLKPDVLVRTRVAGAPVRLVLDAKDYREGAWPGTADLTKQILYRLMLSNQIYPKGDPLESIGNAFLFPAAVPEGVRRRGVHRLIGRVGAGRPGELVGLDVDLTRVSDAYLGGRVDRKLLARIGELAYMG